MNRLERVMTLIRRLLVTLVSPGRSDSPHKSKKVWVFPVQLGNQTSYKRREAGHFNRDESPFDLHSCVSGEGDVAMFVDDVSLICIDSSKL